MEEDDEEDEPAQHRGRIIAMGNGIITREYAETVVKSIQEHQ